MQGREIIFSASLNSHQALVPANVRPIPSRSKFTGSMISFIVGEPFPIKSAKAPDPIKGKSTRSSNREMVITDLFTVHAPNIVRVVLFQVLD
jgi:hypothetical protein